MSKRVKENILSIVKILNSSIAAQNAEYIPNLAWCILHMIIRFCWMIKIAGLENESIISILPHTTKLF